MPTISHSQAMSDIHTKVQNKCNKTFSLEGLIHTPQLSNGTLKMTTHFHSKVPLAMRSHMDTPRESSNLIQVIVCQVLHSNQTLITSTSPKP